MSERLFESVQTHLGSDAESRSARASADTPFRILFIGDFSGRAQRGLHSATRLNDIKPQLIDRDNFDDLMHKLDAELRVRPLGENTTAIDIKIAAMDDFHPDELYEKLNIFKDLRNIRKNLANPDTFAQAKAEVGAWTAPTQAEPPNPQTTNTVPPPANPANPSSANLLDAVMGANSAAAPAFNERSWNALLRQIVAPHVIPAADPKQAELMGYVDTAIAVMMRALMHDPAFQEIEAAWRALSRAVYAIDTDTQLKLYVMDITKDEWADATAITDGASPWRRFLINAATEKFGDESWALVAANYTFDDGEADVSALTQAALIAQAAGVPLIAAASTALLGCRSLAATPDPDDWREPLACAEAWSRLRDTTAARHVALAAPRILQRMPYGKNTDAVTRFQFEEAGENWRHDDYVWGSPAFACATLLAYTFSDSGWDFTAIAQDIDDLPLHTVHRAGETGIKPCAEIALSEKAATRMLACGVAPMASIKNEDRVRLVRLQSIASDGGALAGSWG